MISLPSGGRLLGDWLRNSSSWTIAAVLTTCIASLIVLFIAGHCIRTIYFHPLSKFPGSKRAIVSDIFYARTVISGHSHTTMEAMHNKYGEVIRWAPNELSFSCADAWKDIYGPRKSGNVFVKDPKFYPTDDTIRAKHIVNTSDPVEHANIRKMMSRAFSAKALLEQEDIVIQYADMLMTAILEESRKGPIDLTTFYNWVTFDILGELAFGEAFGSMRARKTDDWIAIILKMIKWNAWDSAFHRLPLLQPLMKYVVPKDLAEGAVTHITQSKRKILARLQRPNDRLDFVSYIFKKREEIGITDWEMAAHANALVIAGSETSATVLSGLTYWLCRTPAVYQKLKDEVRQSFKSTDEITSQTATPLNYLTACINEVLRIYPPIAIGMPRVAPDGGETVAGHFVPGGTTVSVHMWSTSHNENNFKDPYTFRPERWLDPNTTDNLDASKPFLLGPRACMGQK